MREVRGCDFGIFVFSPNDMLDMRGKLLKAPRDNVVYELGLFSGALGTERCFFVVPRDVEVHLPSDLLGLTAGTYDSSRPVGEIRTALLPFCNDVIIRVKSLGNRALSDYEKIVGLAYRYEECGFIDEMNIRVTRKEHIFSEMVLSCRNLMVSKRRLISSDSTGFLVALSASILANPEIDDPNLLLSCDPLKATRGHTQHKVIDAMELLKKRRLITPVQKAELSNWASRMPDPEPRTPPRLSSFAL